ncbi:MAG: hypothetical protein ACFCVD_19545 [Nodosilinea sp.]
MPTTKIRVTTCDNELYILAVQHPSGTSEIGHIVSGFRQPVDYSVFPQSVLKPGKYTLVLVGINWGAQQAFKVTLTTDGVDQVHEISSGNTEVPAGANWTKAIPITV